MALKGVTYAAGTVLAGATVAIPGGVHGGIISVRDGTQYGFIEKTGALVIPARLDDVGRFRLGKASVKWVTRRDSSL